MSEASVNKNGEVRAVWGRPGLYAQGNVGNISAFPVGNISAFPDTYENQPVITLRASSGADDIVYDRWFTLDEMEEWAAGVLVMCAQQRGG